MTASAPAGDSCFRRDPPSSPTPSSTKARRSPSASATRWVCAACCRPRVFTIGEQLQRVYGNFQPQAGCAREIYLPHHPAKSQRDALLPAGAGACGGDDPHHLHADRRPGLSRIRRHFPPPARPVHQHPRTRPHRGDPAPLAASGRAHDRRDRRRAHSRPRRSGRARHGYPRRQAFPLYRLRRLASLLLPARSPWMSAPTTPSCTRIRFISDSTKSVCAVPNTTRSSRSSSARSCKPIPRRCCSGRTSATPTPSACSTSIAEDLQLQ